MARVVLDEDVHKSLAERLGRLGHEVSRAQDIGLGSTPDERIIEFAISTGSVLITGDLGVADIRRLADKDHRGVVLLRFPNEMPTEAIDLEITSLLERLSLDELTGTIAVIEPGSVRLRKMGR